MDETLTPTSPLRLLINGANGRMGQALQRLAAEQPERFVVIGAVTRKVGQRVIDGVPQFASAELAGAPECDVVIDFSLPEAFDAVLAHCVEHGRALVSGTTGLSESQRVALDAAGARIPVLWASNFSLGVAVLADLVERAARSLPGWDVDIVEQHHVRKLDAPSGTALTLGDAAGQGGAVPRYASLRAGDIVGEHTVQFATFGERIELTHRATNRDIFARGALHAAAWLANRPPARYRIGDLLG
ncbi:4-hydroxy-tetrahydrodipicolinate reductase [Lysobacter dokdonensis DS-58]|uniref:4-hydroxy-tetrahydrodipicolinate reductase n=1 Tax=Lysobacter dokdonensis DS-58 TaxID=1300345 RepID=A0A0A2WNC0_9GAMM|nr:4-hydroxy-tetrahydrodipicolinate reductase [Lysobacter dokdonensis]KGQ20217.1 4-hydroxy-tetrahydrodipicolinate reductase [Lysobacter dokdonensis DS-58]